MEQQEPKKKRSWWFIGAIGLYIVTKGKYILSVLKFSKLGATLLSMFITIGAYAIVFPVQFAVGLVIMILIHEVGHVIAAKQKGLPVSAPLFIPFLGALITMKKNPRDAVTEAYIAFGGPILGTIGALIAYILGVMLESHIMLVIANVGFFLNLINLMPIHPLDGGRISTAVTRWLWLVGLVGGLVVVVMLKNIIFFIIWALFAWDLYQKFIKNKGGRNVRSVVSTIIVSLEELRSSGALIPGEDHKRVLPFETYSTLDGEQLVGISWNALGINQLVRFPQGIQGLIRKVHVIRIENNPPAFPQQLVVHCQIDFEVYEPDNYYEVPVQVRWKYGAVYAALAIFLIYMLYEVQEQGIPSVM